MGPVNYISLQWSLLHEWVPLAASSMSCTCPSRRKTARKSALNKCVTPIIMITHSIYISAGLYYGRVQHQNVRDDHYLLPNDFRAGNYKTVVYDLATVPTLHRYRMEQDNGGAAWLRTVKLRRTSTFDRGYLYVGRYDTYDKRLKSHAITWYSKETKN